MNKLTITLATLTLLSLTSCGVFEAGGGSGNVYTLSSPSPSPSPSASASNTVTECPADVVSYLTTIGLGTTYYSNPVDTGGGIADFSPTGGVHLFSYELPASATKADGSCSLIGYHLYDCVDAGHCSNTENTGSQSGTAAPQSMESGQLVMANWFTGASWKINGGAGCIQFHIGSQGPFTLYNAILGNKCK